MSLGVYVLGGIYVLGGMFLGVSVQGVSIQEVHVQGGSVLSPFGFIAWTT